MTQQGAGGAEELEAQERVPGKGPLPRAYRLGSTGLIHGPGMLENMRRMCRTGEFRRATLLFAAMYPDVPVADALAILGAEGEARVGPEDGDAVLVTVTSHASGNSGGEEA